ncbi:MAG: three-Cys-motif partner protein TcmP [Chloroflexota bacterium]|nr:three-Cys-motif partner protein TcmP [Chloroflexota bacterium]
MTLVEAADGHAARQVEAWSEDKLFYVERYMNIFTGGMKRKWANLVYADLFAGPGINIDADSGQESLGSALLAVKAPFTKVFLSDADRDVVEALRARTADQDRERVRVECLDCNEAPARAREFLFPPGLGSGTLGLALLDPFAYQISFDSVRRLSADVPLDLIITFMTNFARRFLYEPGFGPGSDFERFMGTAEYRVWRDEPQQSVTRSLLDLYERQLRGIGYPHVDDDSRILNTKNSTMYHLVFASKDPRGADFFKKISQVEPTGQRRLPGFSD